MAGSGVTADDCPAAHLAGLHHRMGTPDRRQPVTTYTTRAANYVVLRTLEDSDG